MIYYYEELSREAELREKRATWRPRRNALNNKRNEFLQKEKEKLDKMREEMKKDIENEATTTQDSTVEEFVPSSDGESTVTKSNNLHKNDETSVLQSTTTTSHGIRAMDSTIQHLIYNSFEPTRDNNDTKSATTTTTTVAQNLTYENKNADSSSNSTDSQMNRKKPMTRAMDSTAQNLMYHSEEQTIVYKSTRGVGAALQSSIQKHIYDSDIRDDSGEDSGYKTYDSSEYSQVNITRGGEVSVMKEILYPDNKQADVDGQMKEILYPDNKQADVDGQMKEILYPDNKQADVDGQMKSTRGHAPPSTIQYLMYPSTSITEEGMTEMVTFVWIEFVYIGMIWYMV